SNKTTTDIQTRSRITARSDDIPRFILCFSILLHNGTNKVASRPANVNGIKNSCEAYSKQIARLINSNVYTEYWSFFIFIVRVLIVKQKKWLCVVIIIMPSSVISSF